MKELFSILIPSWNNLPYLKLCVESLRKNSTYQHQIIVHINEGTDGSLEWVQSEGIDYTYSEQNIGVCLAMNTMRSKVRTDYIVFFNDDMYACPHWDDTLFEEIKKLPDNRFCFSATAIQRHTTQFRPIIQANYGDSLENFNEESLLESYSSFPYGDLHDATAPPNIMHRDVWDLVGGYSIEFSPGFGSDPDLTMKLLSCGIRMMKSIGTSRVYHFECKSTIRVHRSRGYKLFLLKWGITYRAARMLRWAGRPYDSRNIGRFNTNQAVHWHMFRSRLKIVWYALTLRNFGSVYNFYK